TKMLKSQNAKYNQYINVVMLMYALFLPLSRAGIVFFSALLMLLWILEGNFKSKYLLMRKSKVILALVAFISFNLLSLLWTDNIPVAFQYIKKYWYFLPLVIMFTSIKKEYIAKTLSAFLLGMFISELISYGVFFELWEFKHATVENPTPFMHHIEYSTFLAFTALVLLGRIFNAEEIKYKLLYMVFFVTMTGNMFLTAGRTGQIAFILGLFVLAMISFKNKLKAFLIFTVLSTTLLVFAFYLSTTFNQRIIKAKENLVSVVEDKNYCSSWGARVGAWVVSKDIIVEHPIVGIGIVDNMQEFYRLIDTQYKEMSCGGNTLVHMHNQYLQILTQLGFIGLVIFLSIFYMLAKVQIREREYQNIKYIYLTVILFAFVPEVILHRQFNMALLALVVGLLLAQNRVEHEV
ncbi:MAG: hypothetical protein DRQ78_06210, partial [Epsilonproteobacteria bacterium]